MTARLILAAAIATGILAPVRAQQVSTDRTDQQTAATPAERVPVDGEVRKVDPDAGKITIRHGPIPNLGMPAMTMVFQVRDASLLGKVRTGQKIRFSADKSGGAYIITWIEPAP